MWYYSLLGKSLGPVTDDEFQKLVADGTITPDTAVWNETMTDWKAYKEVVPAGGSASPAASAPAVTTSSPVLEDKPIDTFIPESSRTDLTSPATPARSSRTEPAPSPAQVPTSRAYPEPAPVSPVSPARPASPGYQQPQQGGLVSLNPSYNPVAPAAAGTVYCAECRRPFAEHDVVRIKGQPVCGSCKPTYMQKVKEGVVTPGMGQLNLAHPVYRIAARLVDVLILTVLMVVICIPLFVVVALFNHKSGMEWLVGVTILLTYAAIALASFSYIVYFTVAWGGTPGKFVLGLKVVTPDGATLGWGRSIGRFFATMVTDMTCCIGYIWAFFDEQNRTLHDIICDTRVIKQ